MTATRVPLRVEQAQLGLVMDRLDSVEAARDVAAKRRYTRYAFRTRTPITMQCQRADGSVCYEVAPRNLSSRGLSVLFGAFIYPQTPCQLSLPKAAGGVLQVQGTLLWCRHVSRTVHEGGIEFEDRIDVGEILELAAEPDRSEITGSSDDLHRVVAAHAERLALLARDQRSLKELREAFDHIRRAIDREGAAKSAWVQ